MGFSEQSFQWTYYSKTSLVELIYALFAAGDLNHGRCEIRELSTFFEQAFNVLISDIYRISLETKIRSIPTKFIDTLKAICKIKEEY